MSVLWHDLRKESDESRCCRVTSRVSDAVIPFIWVEEVRSTCSSCDPLTQLLVFAREQLATADDKAAARFKSAIQNKLVIGNALIICLLIVGVGMLLVSILFLYIRRRRERKLLEALNSSPDIKSSYSSLPTKDAPPS